MEKRDVLLIGFFIVTSAAAPAVTAQDQFINCRKFDASIKIIIDGDPSDWPLASYGEPATLPDIPEGENLSDNATSNAVNQVPLQTGDHFVYDPNKALISAGATASFEAEGEGDFSATTYIGWDDAGFYLLNLVKDNLIGWFHGYSDNRDLNNQPGFTNDGIELWFDNDNDRLPPNNQNDQSSEFDLQTAWNIDAVLLKEEYNLDPPYLTGDGMQYVERAIFRSALNTDDEEEMAILEKVQYVAKLDEKPMGQHEGYVQEFLFPWGVFPSFDKAEPIGFNLNWIDFDNKVFQLMRWHQANESDLQYFREMRFTSDNPLGGARIEDWTIQ